MVKVLLKDGTEKEFCLKSWDRERSIVELSTWFSRHCPEKKFKVRTTENEEFILKVSDIQTITRIEQKVESTDGTSVHR